VGELERTIQETTSPEIQRRAIETLKKVNKQPPSPEVFRRVRAMQVLERVGSVEAQKLLSQFAAGDARLPETAEAKAALERLAGIASKP
jgi:hypothetical protein